MTEYNICGILQRSVHREQLNVHTESCNRFALRIEQYTQMMMADAAPRMMDDSENRPYPSKYLPTPLLEPSSRLCSPHARSVLFAATETTCAMRVDITKRLNPIFDAASTYCMYTSVLTRPCSLCSLDCPPLDDAPRPGCVWTRTALEKLCLRCSFSLRVSSVCSVNSWPSTAVPEDGVEPSSTKNGVATPDDVAVRDPWPFL